MFPEMFVGIVQDVAVEFPRAPVGVDVLVRAALGEVDTVAAENAQEAIGIPAAVLEETVVIPRAPRWSEAAEIGGRAGQGGKDGVTERFRTDFVLIEGNHPIGFDEAEGVFELGRAPLQGCCTNVAPCSRAMDSVASELNESTTMTASQNASDSRHFPSRRSPL